MKILFLSILAFLISSLSFGQTQSITVVHLKNGSAIIECKKVIAAWNGIFEVEKLMKENTGLAHKQILHCSQV